MHENDHIAPAKVGEVIGKLRLGLRGVEMTAFFSAGESRREIFGVEVAYPNLVTAPVESGDGMFEHGAVQ